MLKKKLCNWLIRNNMVEPYQVIKVSYSNNRMNGGMERYDHIKDISPAITTRADCLGVVVYVVSEDKR